MSRSNPVKALLLALFILGFAMLFYGGATGSDCMNLGDLIFMVGCYLIGIFTGASIFFDFSGGDTNE